MEIELRKQLMLVLQDKLTRLNIRESELGDSFDLVKSGLLNSLEFVDMVASLEKEFNTEIDFEEGLNSGELTTISGLSKAFLKKI
jgi:acyl carrier protein